jgi:benzoylformate decarboxylase
MREATLDRLRGLGMTTMFGMANGYARATGRAAFCNLHSAAGLGHALGNVFTAQRNHAPLVITAGQPPRRPTSPNPM